MEYYEKLESALCAAFKKAEIQFIPAGRCVVGRWDARATTNAQPIDVVSVADSTPVWVEDWMYDDK